MTILLFSLLFYAWGEGTYLLLLLFTVGVNYFFGKYIHKNNSSPVKSKYWLWAGVTANLVILIYYKYFGFIANSVLNLGLRAGNIPLLPLGISFFIFQSISYLMDVYRRDSPPAKSLFDLGLYITMFPQLVAGPIVRFSTVSAAINQRSINVLQIRDGALFFVGGLAQKMLIANKAGQIADVAFGLPYEQVNVAIAWVGAAAYSLQIFFDFSGYSTMAIGVGLIMGFEFPENFNYPYISRSITEFWRRWHISLSSWFRDYLYIPLGGNRKGPLRTYLNLFIVFLLCGLWHGAAWTFLAWGAYHGVLLIVERLCVKRILLKLPTPFSFIYTMFLILVGWILFRADNFNQAAVFISALFGTSAVNLPPQMLRVLTHENITFCLLGIVLSTPVVPKIMSYIQVRPQTDLQLTYSKPRLLVLCGMAMSLFMVCCMYIYAGTYNPFIYFRF